MSPGATVAPKVGPDRLDPTGQPHTSPNSKVEFLFLDAPARLLEAQDDGVGCVVVALWMG
jgi:hypothetical protein